MGSMLPEELIASISQQWLCRELQIRQLATLLCPELPSPPAIFIHGPQTSGKSSVTRAILSAYENQNESRTPEKKTLSKNNSNKRKQRGDETLIQGIQVDEKLLAGSYFLASTIKVAECITARHLLAKIVSSTIATVQRAGSGIFVAGQEEEWMKTVDKLRCEHVSSLPAVLNDILGKTRCGKYVLLLDGVVELREGGQMLLAALARIGELVPSLSVIFVSKFTPRPMFLQIAGVPHIYFPPYSRNELLSILSSLPPPSVPDLLDQTAAKLYPSFLSTLYDSLVGPAAGTVPVFRAACEKLWPRFVAPIVHGERPPGGEWDFSRLLVKNRTLFQQQGEHLLVHRIVPSRSYPFATNSMLSLTKNTKSQLPALPYVPTLILTAAFLAAYIPQRVDIVFFSKFASSKKKRIRRRGRANIPSQNQVPDLDADDPTQTPSKRGKKSTAPSRVTKQTPASSSTAFGARKGVTNFLTPRPFSLERMLAIYHAIDPNPPLTTVPPVADALAPDIATLQRLRLLVPASSAAAASGGAIDGGEKWCLNVNITVSSSSSVNEEWIVEMARGIGVDIDEYLAVD